MGLCPPLVSIGLRVGFGASGLGRASGRLWGLWSGSGFGSALGPMVWVGLRVGFGASGLLGDASMPLKRGKPRPQGGKATIVLRPIRTNYCKRRLYMAFIFSFL